MSQQVKITRARLHGSAVYLGEVTGGRWQQDAGVVGQP
ncbi:hypothetical protein LAUMK4_05690 [Mycobacterium persicum]|uniref:Uncharacterized protein n=1 Tax=Mycobacterium persicum TaxID=1487726 RepID=A0ABY6RS34_9MYCO|nr:hypothetical protein LAUMK4_05690 [Mycobacterium persicum]